MTNTRYMAIAITIFGVILIWPGLVSTGTLVSARPPVLSGAALADAPVAFAAVNGRTARSRAKSAVARVCGGTWWVCVHVSNAVCVGRGGGEWDCYVADTERHKLIPWRYRVCNFYVWVPPDGLVGRPSKLGCERV